MATMTEPTISRRDTRTNLVEVHWDPITRIVGNLGIFTKIDFENRQVAGVVHLHHLWRTELV